MSEQIDWSKAPEWATHAMTTGPKWDGTPELKGSIRFARLKGVKYVDYSGREEAVLMIGKRSWVVAEERPASQWSGDGLPPVGIDIEVMHGTYGWIGARVVGHDGEATIVRTNDGYAGVFPHEYRAIRTEAQIAAEDRKKAVLEMAKDSASPAAYLKPVPEIFGRLYDVGYRKQEPKP